jgi:hypothetical protein
MFSELQAVCIQRRAVYLEFSSSKKYTLKNKGKIRTFSGRKILREFVGIRSSPQY